MSPRPSHPARRRRTVHADPPSKPHFWNAQNPLWRLIDKLVLVGVIAGVIYFNANSFDSGEMTSILTITAGAFARDWVFKH